MYYKDEFDDLKEFAKREDIDNFIRKQATRMISMMELLDGINFIDAGALILTAIETVYAPDESDFIAEMLGHYKEWKAQIESGHDRPLDNLFGDVGKDLDELFGGDEDE